MVFKVIGLLNYDDFGLASEVFYKYRPSETALKRPRVKLGFVPLDQVIACGAFVLKVERQDQNLRFQLHDLRTGKKLEFLSWLALEQHIESYAKEGLH